MTVSCRDLIETLDDYVANAQTPDERADCEAHLARCPYCREYVQTYRATIDLLRRALAEQPDAPVSPELAEALARTVLDARKPDPG